MESRYYRVSVFLLVLISCLQALYCVELTFELPDNAKQCFHEDIRQNVKSTIEFQVFLARVYF